jgi:hypothetical protein
VEVISTQGTGPISGRVSTSNMTQQLLLSKQPGPTALHLLRKMVVIWKKPDDLTGNRTRAVRAISQYLAPES